MLQSMVVIDYELFFVPSVTDSLDEFLDVAVDVAKKAGEVRLHLRYQISCKFLCFYFLLY